ncbi:MAG: response regulator [Polyangiales bacterium]
MVEPQTSQTPAANADSAPRHAAAGERGDCAIEGAEELLGVWRQQVLQGVITTALLLTLPAWSLQYWQSTHHVDGAHLGLWSNFAGLVVLAGSWFWRGPYLWRAGSLLAAGTAVFAAAVWSEGLAPAQCVLACLLTVTAAVLLSARAAAAMLLVQVTWVTFAAVLFSRGLRVVQISQDHVAVDDPLNWLRVGMYTLFGSATAGVAAGYLLGKLRETLQARTRLLDKLRSEVAERERTAAALEQTRARLAHAQKLEAIGQLAAGIAHDFNNTLSVVSLEAELIKRRSSAEPVLQSADSLLSAAMRGKQLTQQLLLFSRAERKGQAHIEATEVLTACVDALRRLLPSELTFEIAIAPGPLWLPVDEGELQQIVLNLGINARDALAGRRSGRLRVSLETVQLGPEQAAPLGVAPGMFALLRCEDTGAGMGPSTLQRVFEPFFTTKPPGRGTGLGLTNVWNIVQRSRGVVQLDSTLDVGTTCRVYLPLIAAGVVAEATRASSSPPAKREATILVVEDDIRIRALIVTTLAEAGYSVLDAANVDNALDVERTHRGPIDVLCTDIVMPGRPARELIAELRARRPNIGVLICSGYSADEQIARGIQSGETKQLDKPFTRAALLTAIRTVLPPRVQPPEHAEARH